MYKIPDNTVWVSFDAETLQGYFAHEGIDISSDKAQELLDDHEEEIVDAMSNAGADVLWNIVDTYKEDSHD